jgi:hypothetical protein
MQVLNITCDRCKQPAAENRAVYELRGGPPNSPATLDLCNRCLEQLTAWLRVGASDQGGNDKAA